MMPVRDALGEAARPLLEACRGRRVARRNYHLTLAFSAACGPGDSTTFVPRPRRCGRGL
jgi:2'-5' RNA ligase